MAIELKYSNICVQFLKERDLKCSVNDFHFCSFLSIQCEFTFQLMSCKPKQLNVRLGITERQLFAKSRIMNEMLSPAREC